jgi:hypothetical protein
MKTRKPRKRVLLVDERDGFLTWISRSDAAELLRLMHGEELIPDLDKYPTAVVLWNGKQIAVGRARFGTLLPLCPGGDA